LIGLFSDICGERPNITLSALKGGEVFDVSDMAAYGNNDQDGYNKEFLPVISKVQQEVGGKFLARGGKAVSFMGAPPAPRIVVIQYNNMERR
jgi:uncharacterized protein (DUF1330 family)